jgi:hypothetical protein
MSKRIVIPVVPSCAREAATRGLFPEWGSDFNSKFTGADTMVRQGVMQVGELEIPFTAQFKFGKPRPYAPKKTAAA